MYLSLKGAWKGGSRVCWFKV